MYVWQFCDARQLLGFSLDSDSAMEERLRKARTYAECQGHNIMICKDCFPTHMRNLTRYSWEPDLKIWCFDYGSFSQEPKVRIQRFANPSRAGLATNSLDLEDIIPKTLHTHSALILEAVLRHTEIRVFASDLLLGLDRREEAMITTPGSGKVISCDEAHASCMLLPDSANFHAFGCNIHRQYTLEAF